MFNVLAIVCMRNEAIHARRCISDLAGSGCDVWVIDNGSTDGTREIVEELMNKGVIGVTDLPWTGAFSLSDQLRAKRTIVNRVAHDWVVHADADEQLVSPVPGQGLREGIEVADAQGFNCVNFHELVFVPLPGQDFYRPDYVQLMDAYYFFQPHYPRLNRAWKRNAALDNQQSGGHVLSGENLLRYPRDFFLRHYIVLSEEHARTKYVGRAFSEEDRNKQWHDNRVIITADNLRLRPHAGLRKLSHPSSNNFDLSSPLKEHFWQWPDSGAT